MSAMLRASVLGVLFLWVSGSACFRLSRASPPVERYVLGGIQDSAVRASGPDTTGLAVGLRRIVLAPYLSTLAIVVRREDNEIITSGFHRWAESPAAGLNRAVSGYVAALPEVRSVDVAPWPIRTPHDFIIQLHILRLEGVMRDAQRGEAHLLARWEILRPSDGILLARGVTDHRADGWDVGDYAGLVSTLDEGLVHLAEQLAECLLQLRARPLPDSVVTAPAALGCGTQLALPPRR